MPRNRQAQSHLRNCILRLKKFSIEDLELRSGVSRSVTQRYVRELFQNGFLKKVQHRQKGKVGGDVYCLANSCGLPMSNLSQDAGKDARSQAWTAMRFFHQFQLRDLLTCSEISEENAKKYLHYLLQTDYLQILRPRLNGSSEGNVYRLARNSGPLAPVVRRDKTVFDPNVNKVYQLIK